MSLAVITALASGGAALGVARVDNGGGESVASDADLINGVQRFTFSMNDDDPSLITFNNNSRQVRTNASLMGHIGTGQTSTTKLRPPAGWSVLWGDPAITKSLNPNFVYLSSLAVPNEKMPASGVIEGPAQTSAAGMCGAFVGGACIARSSNGGQSFTLNSGDCLRKITSDCPGGVFYDGADMANAQDGSIYAAYRDVQHNTIDVWKAPSLTGSFVRVTDFPASAFNHPRLKNGPLGLYVLFEGSSGLMITRYPKGSSTTAAWTTPALVTSRNVVKSIDFGNGIGVRNGPEFSLDIGLNDSNTAVVRAMYSVLDSSNRNHIGGSECTTGATITCSENSIWNTSSLFSNSEEFRPNVKFGAFGNRNGVIGTWTVSYHQRAVGDPNVKVRIGRITNSLQTGALQESGQVPCPDRRPKSSPTAPEPPGYWGDYDNIAAAPSISFFFRGFEDSTDRACQRFLFHADPQNVSFSQWIFQ